MSDTTEPEQTVETTVVEPQRSPLGDNQKMAIGVLLVTYVTATGFVAAGLADATWWAGFMSTFLPSTLGIVIGSSALIKTAAAIRGREPIPAARKVTVTTGAPGVVVAVPPVVPSDKL